MQDEIGALASSHSPTAVDSTLEGVLPTLSNKMDGVEELVSVTVISTPEALMRSPVQFLHCRTVPPLHAFLRQDPVLMRPRRLDRILYVGLPDFAGRVKIFRIPTSNMTLEHGLDLDAIVALVPPRFRFHGT